MIFLAVEPPPVTHPSVTVCGGPAIFCEINYASLITSALAIAITLAVGFYVASRVSSGRPGKLQLVFELLADYTRDLIRSTAGEDALFIMPLALTIFFYILVANWMEFLPLPHPFTPATTDFNQTLAMAAVVWIGAEGYSIYRRGVVGFLRHLTRPPELSWALRVPFTLINLIEELTKPLSLSLRLMGNIFGGAVMLWVLTVLLPEVPLPVVPYAASVVLVAVWKVFDVFLIGSLQAVIFFLLTVIYFGQAVEGLEEHGHSEQPHGSLAPAASHASQEDFA